MKPNMITQLALAVLIYHVNYLPTKSWEHYLLMDAAMFRYKNPGLPYTDISRRLVRFLVRRGYIFS
jgi:hypothetical protein